MKKKTTKKTNKKTKKKTERSKILFIVYLYCNSGRVSLSAWIWFLKGISTFRGGKSIKLFYLPSEKGSTL